MPRQFYLIIGFLFLVAATIGLMIAAIFLLNEDTSFWTTSQEKPAQNSPMLVPQPAPEINIYRTGTAKKPTLTISWKNLAKDTIRIRVFRSGACTIEEWQLWKIINVHGMTEGIVEIALKLSEANCTFAYYTETANEAGNVSWRSSAAPASTDVPPNLTVPTSTVATVSDPPPNPPPPPAPPPAAPPPTTPTSTPTSTTPTTPTSSATSSTPGTTTSTPSGPERNTYYTPQSTVSGYDNPPAGEFWIQHTHQYLEIGWQNLPATTGRIIVYRGDTSSGPWEVLLDQTSPDPTGPYVIRLSDDSLTEPHYYRLEAQNNGIVTGSYGPYLLEALSS